MSEQRPLYQAGQRKAEAVELLDESGLRIVLIPPDHWTEEAARLTFLRWQERLELAAGRVLQRAASEPLEPFDSDADYAQPNRHPDDH